MTLVAVVAAAVIGFIGSGIYYSALADALEAARPGLPTPRAPLDLRRGVRPHAGNSRGDGRCCFRRRDRNLVGGMALGLTLWVSFPLLLCAGAILGVLVGVWT
jgi:hypothetical protein